jgi:hypothetical protein
MSPTQNILTRDQKGPVLIVCNFCAIRESHSKNHDSQVEVTLIKWRKNQC